MIKTIELPGKFDSFFSGTGVVAGDPYSDDPLLETGARLLEAAYHDRYLIRRGKGYSLRLDIGSHATSEEIVTAALHVLWDYADSCLVANSDEPDHSEVASAKTVLARLAAMGVTS